MTTIAGMEGVRRQINAQAEGATTTIGMTVLRGVEDLAKNWGVLVLAFFLLWPATRCSS
jgi:hypothetical protein